ncbi:uncharacterized protein EV420DRAFT_1508789 [Desarmillaria tabescens]|uniref:F-box domain-containing protein n=1 Tax=Armillaria tabescens TaxID=1929756 RepID=A0AA39NHU4_ARMTA|nr:uncharacterized protein EV420DRAFT_1508789 [Desarmillaria tabescens]KAK0465918.1 hypothetical protein EV420DRAFT_1508789 [Desarmillaria tabescens]
MPLLDLPPEILDAIIDELHGNKKSLLRASLACRAFYPRTRIHLFSVALLRGKSDCDRLRELITMAPKLALHFKSLEIKFTFRTIYISPVDFRALTVIESLINVTCLSLSSGSWHAMPDSVVSSLQSHSYHTLVIGQHFHFRSMGEICLLVKNSPDLQEARIMCSNSGITEECNMNHSLHFTPAPVTIHIDGSQDSAETLMKLVLSSGPCPFSCTNVDTLSIALEHESTTVLQCLNEYLTRSRRSLKHIRVTHFGPGFRTASSETLDVSSIEQIVVTVVRISPLANQISHILDWWISNLAAVNENCAIRSITFKIISLHPEPEEDLSLDWKDLWMRLDACCTSSKMTLLERVAVTFRSRPRPAEWDTFKTRMEGNFPRLKELGCEVVLNAM